MDASLGRLRARGKTPISESLRRAVKALPAKGENNHVILLADGFENCRADPCRTAKRLKKKMPGLKIHVLAYGFRKASRGKIANLRCIATNTKGEFSQAYSRKELKGGFYQNLRQALCAGKFSR